MALAHKVLLCAALIFLGISLIIPGLIEVLKPQPGIPGLIPETLSAKNQLRALNAVMTAVGFLALWACFDLENAQTLILVLGSILLLVSAARIYSILVDGDPGFMSRIYLLIELGLAALFLIWPPVK